MANDIFTVSDLSFSYGGKTKKEIFNGLSLTVKEGKVTTFIGANGSGKSTLFNLMTKNLKPTAGSIFLRGGNVADLRLRDFSRLVAIVHQYNSSPSDLSVESLVAYGRAPYQNFHTMLSREEAAEDERMVAWAIETCNLGDVADRPVSALSGGQCQRVWIAMALAQGTRVLLLDEPTTYLDIRYQLDILRLVRRLNKEFDMTVVMVLHDMNQALCYSDEVVALARGQVAAQGDPADIVTPALLKQVYGVDLEMTAVDGKPFVLAV